jgi:hypothetical protein
MPEYTWKHAISGSSNRGLTFDRPLLEGMVFADLLTGKTYRVHSLYKAKEHDRITKSMPEDVVQTFDAKELGEKELLALRKKLKFEVNDSLNPEEEFAILSLEARGSRQ